jgi:hypothetical protein
MVFSEFWSLDYIKYDPISSNHNPLFSSIFIYLQYFKESNTTGATSRAEAAYPYKAPEFTTVF